MRLLLDNHPSGRRIGAALRESGHNVLAVEEVPGLEACSDNTIMEIATAAERILVTCDVRDFSSIARARAEGGLHHAGVLVLVGLQHHDFGLIIRRIEAALAERGSQLEWADVTSVYGPGRAE